MTKLNTQAVSAIRAANRRRYLAPGDEQTAKQQAYILRDLIKQHCGVKLSGGDVTDCFSLLYHGMDWASLIANQRGEQADIYYGTTPRDVITLAARDLRSLIGPNAGPTVRPLLDMPCAEYSQARTMAGVKLATLLQGSPSWSLYDLTNSETKPLIYDAESDTGFIPKHFNSDPMTNAERLCAQHPVTGERIIIPIEQVRYVRLQRPEGEAKTDYVLSEHTRGMAAAQAFAKTAVSYELARRWFNAGNDLFVMVFHSGTKTVRCQLGEWVANPQQWDFDQAMAVLREFYPGCNVVMTPRGLDEVRDPAERWAPSFKHVRAILPEVEAADAAFQSVLDRAEGPNSVFVPMLREATRRYNEVLMRALDCFWHDTREINSRSTLIQAYGTTDPEERLALAQYGPLQKLRELIGLDAKGNPKKSEQEELAALRDAETTQARIGGWN